MPPVIDGPASSLFSPLSLSGGAPLTGLAASGASAELIAAAQHAPTGWCVSWGIPFEINGAFVAGARPVSVAFAPTTARWLVFLHTSDIRPVAPGPGGIISPMRGRGQLGEHAADYVIGYADGEEMRLPIRRRHHLGMFTRAWGENCFEAVAHRKPRPLRAENEPVGNWGHGQTLVDAADAGLWVNWLWAWENPRSDMPITSLRIEPISGIVVLSAVTVGCASEQPLRWWPRRKAVVVFPAGAPFQPDLDDAGLLAQVQLDMGQVISATPRPLYPNQDWPATYSNRPADLSTTEALVEYTAHTEACFHLLGGGTVAVRDLEANIPPARCASLPRQRNACACAPWNAPQAVPCPSSCICMVRRANIWPP